MGAENALKATAVPENKQTRKGLIEEIKNRISHELVFGVSGQIGAGNSLTAELIGQKLLAHEYLVYPIKLTELAKTIIDPKQPPELSLPPKAVLEANRVEALQNHCDNIRERYGHDALAQLACTKIGSIRQEHLDKPDDKKNLRIAYVIDSLKHPDEAVLLRQVYRSAFILVGIESPADLRKTRLTSRKGMPEKDFDRLSARDKEDEEKAHGQKVAATVELSDIFLRNDSDTESELEKKIVRFVRLIAGTEKDTPTTHETSMYAAYANAARSGCLSRQVGAVIVSTTGEILSTGTNDVPAFGGGLYTCEADRDERCYNKGDECFNNLYKKQLYQEIFTTLREKKLVPSENEDGVLKVLENSRIKRLIEFSRAVHAEMEAIIGLARKPSASSVGATLYCTTYPCHSCARHIVSAGIVKVYYIEPYTKSLATKLHSDSISNNEKEDTKVHFLPYEGVAPQRYLSFFQAAGRKNRGVEEKSSPKTSLYLDDFYDTELKVIQNAADIGLVKHDKGGVT